MASQQNLQPLQAASKQQASNNACTPNQEPLGEHARAPAAVAAILPCQLHMHAGWIYIPRSVVEACGGLSNCVAGDNTPI